MCTFFDFFKLDLLDQDSVSTYIKNQMTCARGWVISTFLDVKNCSMVS